MRELMLKMEMDYIERKGKYDLEVELLRLQREHFYKNNPDFPIKTMYMQVTAPPQKISINLNRTNF